MLVSIRSAHRLDDGGIDLLNSLTLHMSIFLEPLIKLICNVSHRWVRIA